MLVLQRYSVSVSELLRENQLGVKLPPPTQIRVKMSTVEHKYES